MLISIPDLNPVVAFMDDQRGPKPKQDACAATAMRVSSLWSTSTTTTKEKRHRAVLGEDEPFSVNATPYIRMAFC